MTLCEETVTSGACVFKKLGCEGKERCVGTAGEECRVQMIDHSTAMDKLVFYLCQQLYNTLFCGYSMVYSTSAPMMNI